MEPLVLTGLSFKSIQNMVWTFGNLIDKGAFGRIYETTFNDEKNFIIKTGQNTVFYEKAVLRRLASDCENHIPVVIDSGRLTSLGLDCYFIVMKNYGKSLDSMIKVDPLNAGLLNSMMTDVLFALNYLNFHKMIHLDVKPENIMFTNSTKTWYLIDFGLAKSFRNGKFEKDKQYANNGTPLYMARDAHIGIMSRKCDLESLVYTMLVSEGVDLPWKKTKNKKTLLIQKTSFFIEDVKKLQLSEYQKTFIAEVDILSQYDEPDYNKFKSFFISEMSQSDRDLLLTKALSNLAMC